MQINRLTNVGTNYVYTWPGGDQETFKFWVEYEACDGFGDDMQEHVIRIGFGEREAFGSLRQRIVVWIDRPVAIELTGADDFEVSGECLSVLQEHRIEGESLKNVRHPDDPVPQRYLMFEPVAMKSRIKGDRVPNAWAVAVNVADHRKMAALAALKNLERVWRQYDRE